MFDHRRTASASWRTRDATRVGTVSDSPWTCPPGAFNLHERALHERKDEADSRAPSNQRVTCTRKYIGNPWVTRSVSPATGCPIACLGSLPKAQSVDLVTLARDASSTPGHGQPPRLPLKRHATGHRAALRSVSALPRVGYRSPGSLSAAERPPMCVAHAGRAGQRQTRGSEPGHVCLAARESSVVLFRVWSAVPERVDTTTQHRVGGRAAPCTPVPPRNDVPVPAGVRHIYGSRSARTLEVPTPIA